MCPPVKITSYAPINDLGDFKNKRKQYTHDALLLYHTIKNMLPYIVFTMYFLKKKTLFFVLSITKKYFMLIEGMDGRPVYLSSNPRFGALTIEAALCNSGPPPIRLSPSPHPTLYSHNPPPPQL